MARRGKAVAPVVEGAAQGAAAAQAGMATPTLALPEKFGIAEVSAFRDQLVTLVEEPQPVVLDAERVMQIHSAALQLLVMFCRDRRDAGRKTQWHAPSSVFTSAAALIGANPLLQLA